MTSSVWGPALLEQDAVPLAHHSVQEPVLPVWESGLALVEEPGLASGEEPGLASVEEAEVELELVLELQLALLGYLVQAWAGQTPVSGLPVWVLHQAPPPEWALQTTSTAQERVPLGQEQVLAVQESVPASVLELVLVSALPWNPTTP